MNVFPCPYSSIVFSVKEVGSNFRSFITYLSHFNRSIIISSLASKSAPMVTRALVILLLCPYSTPTVLLSSSNKVFTDISSLCNFTQIFIATHDPSSNEVVEDKQKNPRDFTPHRWSASRIVTRLDTILQRASEDHSTGEIPHYIVCGSEKRFP